MKVQETREECATRQLREEGRATLLFRLVFIGFWVAVSLAVLYGLVRFVKLAWG